MFGAREEPLGRTVRFGRRAPHRRAEAPRADIFLKVLIRRPRPAADLDVLLLPAYSFPSGHALVSVAAYGLAAIIVARRFPRLRPLAAVIVPLWVLLIGLSRVYLGVHWATDVLAAFSAGALVLLAGWLATTRWS
jgi:undecaprenyl-diphosphatase